MNSTVTTGIEPDAIANKPAHSSKTKAIQLSPLMQSLLVEIGLFSSEEAATYLGITPGTLEVWRSTKRHIIPFIKVGRLVKYRKSSLDDFLASRTVEF